ncbi:MAG TPA: hypothetical protein VN704_04560, partial [Verrucomicrobiae bacterium]|nr:hypothetical protein [Verrucomicrobiae bacterium]
EDYLSSEEYKSSAQQFIQYLILSSCEISYLNVFLKVLKTDDKENYFAKMRNSIEENIEENKEKEKIYVKYEWLALQYNKFIDLYTAELAYIDDDNEPTIEFIELVKNCKIPFHAN